MIYAHTYAVLLLLCDDLVLGVLHGYCFYCLCVLFVVNGVHKQLGNLKKYHSDLVPVDGGVLKQAGCW